MQPKIPGEALPRINCVQMLYLPFLTEEDRGIKDAPVPVYRWVISTIRFASYGPIRERFGREEGYETAVEAWGAAGELFDTVMDGQ